MGRDTVYRTEAGDVVGDLYIGYAICERVVMRSEDVDSSSAFRSSSTAQAMKLAQKKLGFQSAHRERYREEE